MHIICQMLQVHVIQFICPSVELTLLAALHSDADYLPEPGTLIQFICPIVAPTVLIGDSESACANN